MTPATLQAFREIATDPKIEFRTAREMAMTPHNLSRGGNLAVTRDNRAWGWDATLNAWSTSDYTVGKAMGR